MSMANKNKLTGGYNTIKSAKWIDIWNNGFYNSTSAAGSLGGQSAVSASLRRPI